MFCPECGAMNEEGARFCEGCGKDLKGSANAYSLRENTPPKIDNGIVSSIEKKVYFKIARGFAWLILFFASLSLIGSIVYLVLLFPSLFGGSIKVTKEEINAAISEEERGRTFTPKSYKESNINIELVKKLDLEINDLLYIFPDEARRTEDGIDQIKGFLKNSLNVWPDIKDKIVVAKELKNELKGFSNDTRKLAQAIRKYIEVRHAKEEAEKLKRQESLTKIGIIAGAILSSIITITLGSLVLVLMTIERNTRKNL